MTPSPLQSKIIADRSSWIRRMLANVRSLPLESYSTFAAEPRNAAAAESYLRRALEALLDLGRHILAKGFAEPVSEYKEVARRLVQVGVLDEQRGAQLEQPPDDHPGGGRPHVLHADDHPIRLREILHE